MTDTKTFADVIDHLAYCSYRFNRLHSPEISPERWGMLFANWAAMEAKFQAELAK